MTKIMAKPACSRSQSCSMKVAIAGSIRHRESHQIVDSNACRGNIKFHLPTIGRPEASNTTLQ
jgi:hypothetical protein